MISREKLARLQPDRVVGVTAGELLALIDKADSRHPAATENDEDHEPCVSGRPDRFRGQWGASIGEVEK